MKKKQFSVEQITGILKQAELGAPIAELCRQHGISEQNYYRWKKVYGGMEPSEARELKQLRDENTKLKRIVERDDSEQRDSFRGRDKWKPCGFKLPPRAAANQSTRYRAYGRQARCVGGEC